MDNKTFEAAVREVETNGTANDKYFLAGIEPYELKTIKAIAEEYHKAITQNSEPQCFYEPDIQQKLYDYEDGKIDYPQITLDLNIRANEWLIRAGLNLLKCAVPLKGDTVAISKHAFTDLEILKQ